MPALSRRCLADQQPLFWSKLPAHSIDNTIWSSSPALELDLQDLPVILSAAPAAEKVVKAKPKTNGVTSLLDISESRSHWVPNHRKLMSETGPTMLESYLLDCDYHQPKSELLYGRLMRPF
jgi:hypothetical protein